MIVIIQITEIEADCNTETIKGSLRSFLKDIETRRVRARVFQ